MLTEDQLRTLAPFARPHVVAGILAHQEAIPRFGITTALRLQHFMAQIAHESAGLTALEENLSYSAGALRRVWPHRFPTEEVATAYARQPERIANRAYGGRYGNGPEESGDGWRYRGRGLKQLTFRANYRAAGTRLGMPLEDRPELAAEFPGALLTALDFWATRNCNAAADADDVEALTRIINGGLNGIEDRRDKLYTAKAVFAEALA
jgi:putative chitinase